MFKKLRNSYLSYFLMINFYYLSWALFSSFISVYLLGKGLTTSQVSLIVSISFLVSMIFQPMIGELCDTKGVKFIGVLFILAAIGGLLFSFSTHFITMMIGYSFVLMLINGANPILEKVATASPFAYGKIRIWGTIGYALGSQFAGLIYDYISPEAIFIVFVFTMLLCVCGTYLTEPQIQPQTNKKENTSKELFKNKKFIYFLIISALFFSATNMANTFIPSMFVDGGMSVNTASTILGAAVLFELPLVFFSNKFMDRLSNKFLILVSFTMATLQFASYGFNMAMPIKILMTFMAKHPAGMLYIMIQLKVVHTIVEEKQVITALATIATVKNLASIFSQIAAGYLLEVFSYSHVFIIFTVILFVDVILAILYKIEKGTNLNLFS